MGKSAVVRRVFSIIRSAAANPRVLLYAGIAFIIYSFFFERAGFINQARLKHENRQLQIQLAAARERMQALQEEVAALKNDVQRLKAEAVRNGYAEPDEVIVRIR